MSFFENFKKICDSQNTTPSALCKKMGLSTSKVTSWYKGNLPKQEIMSLLAKQLNCSVSDFFADDNNELFLVAKNDDERDMLRIFRTLSRRAKHEFMSSVYQFETNREMYNEK